MFLKLAYLPSKLRFSGKYSLRDYFNVFNRTRVWYFLKDDTSRNGTPFLGEKMKIYPQVLTFFIKPKTWLFHVVVLLTTATKWTKVKNARARRAKLLFLPTKYANSRRCRCRRRCRCCSLVSLRGRTLSRHVINLNQ